VPHVRRAYDKWLEVQRGQTNDSRLAFALLIMPCLSAPSCRRLITLSSWTLTLCPSGVVAAQGPGPLPPMPPLPDVSVAISGSGISVNLTNSTAADNNSTDSGISVRVGSLDGPATAEQHTQGLLSLLFPGFTKMQGKPYRTVPHCFGCRMRSYNVLESVNS